ncbi:sarcosine oxidase subunit delta, partial [Mesorhizobium sp. M1A.F.Ca.IN.022.07.1.1]
LLDCPMNGPRNIDEFQSFGPLRQRPDADAAADAAADAEWARHLFRADNRKGVVVECWRHVPSNFFFLAERDVVTNEIIRTYAIGSRP